MSIAFSENFDYLLLRKIWINNQIKELISSIQTTIEQFLILGNSAKVIYNTAVDYNDLGFSNAIDNIVVDTVSFNNYIFMPFISQVTQVNKYDNVEVAFKTFATAIYHKSPDADSVLSASYTLTEFQIIQKFLEYLSTFYYNSSDTDDATVNKAILLSIYELEVHANIMELVVNAIKAIYSKINTSRQMLYIYSQSDNNHCLYVTMGILESKLNTFYSSVISIVNHYQKVLMYNLINNYSNSKQNYIDLSTLINTAVTNIANCHYSFMKIFVNEDSTDTSGYAYAITNEDPATTVLTS